MGFVHVIHFGHMTCFMSYDWFRYVAQIDSYESSDGFHTMTHFESWVAWRGSMSHSWGKNPYIRAPSGHEFGFFTQPPKLLSLLLVQSIIFISLSTFEDQSVLSDNDPPYTILIRVLVSQYKREAVVIKLERLPAASITRANPRL